MADRQTQNVAEATEGEKMKPEPLALFAPVTNECPLKIKQVPDEVCAQVRPMIEREGELWFIEPPPSFNGHSFMWSPEYTERATNIEPFATIRTFHTFGYYGLFKPSVAEVVAAIPEAMLPDVAAFHLRGPQDADDLNRERVAMSAGYHVGVATLYRRTDGT